MNHWIAGLIAEGPRQGLPIATSPGIPLIDAAASEVFQSGELQYRAIRALNQIIAAPAALTMMDLSVEAEAFGCPIRFSETENPTVAAPIASDQESIERLLVPEVGTARTKEYLLAARCCAENIADRPTLGGLIGPLSLAGRLADMSRMMLLLATEPETVRCLLEKATTFLIEYAKAFKASGCGGLIMAEPAAGLVSPAMCEEFSSRYIRRIVEAVKDEQFAFVLHNCGKTERLIPSMLGTGASALHVGNAIDIGKVLAQVPGDVPVLGNLDPVGVFRLGSPESVYAATTELLKQTAGFPNFVASSGCDIPPGTPIENLTAFFKALADAGTKPGG